MLAFGFVVMVLGVLVVDGGDGGSGAAARDHR